MNNNLMEAKSLAELGKIKDYLSELDFDMHILEKSPDIPVSLLLCIIPKDYKNRERSINFVFFPVSEDDLKSISLLQIYSVLPGINTTKNIDKIKDLFIFINQRTSIGSFSLNENNEIAYRYILVLNKFKLFEKDFIQEVTTLYNFMLDLFSHHIEAVAYGSKTLENVIKEIENS